ncbi:DUF202 domain-containing protein [Algibacter pacificus]|uniref:DUF202 domain-containing protein n=1 Tax=Algibacter pacificus TaxID=2599389 RepID=UPI0011C95017|nr:DUF202 domain-containing protein [Algibacter pacificus]
MKRLPFGPDFKPDQDIILRDYLSIERTRLANERTLLSYVRSSLYLLIGSLALYELNSFRDFKHLTVIGLVCSALFFIIGVYRFYMLKRSLKRLYYVSKEK